MAYSKGEPLRVVLIEVGAAVKLSGSLLAPSQVQSALSSHSLPTTPKRSSLAAGVIPVVASHTENCLSLSSTALSVCPRAEDQSLWNSHLAKGCLRALRSDPEAVFHTSWEAPR